LIVDEFGSANSYDSLAEAYLKKGNKEACTSKLSTKSLAMNPDNFNAEDQIALIKYPDVKPLSPTEKFHKIYTAEAYKADLDQLGKSTSKNPPKCAQVYHHTLTSLDSNRDQCKSQITDKTTFGEFSYICNKIIASVYCSHTGMGGFYPEHEMLPLSRFFPMQTRWIGNQMYVIDPLNNGDLVKAKDEILAINGVPVATIIDKIYQHIPAQGYVKTTKNHVFNSFSSTMLPYALGLPETYSITVKGRKNPIVLNKAEKPLGPYWDYLKYCPNLLCIEYLDDQKTALMTIESFNYYSWNNLQVFIDFVDQNLKK
jgi:hypothetical protein